MAKNKTTSQKKEAVSKTGIEKYNVTGMMGYADGSGNATKKSTVIGNGNYPVMFHLRNGASAVMSACYLVAAGMKKAKSVPANALVNVLGKVIVPGTHEGKVVDTLLKKYSKDTGRSFNNLKTLRSRIIASVNKGATLNFVIGEGQDEEVEAVLALAKSVK